MLTFLWMLSRWVLLLATTLSAQDLTSLVLVGDASKIPDGIRLASAKRYQRGAAWFPGKRNVAGGFDLSFRFRITDRDRSYGGADGIAFVIQNSGTAAIGADGGAGGFAPARPEDAQRPGIELSLSVFFDMYHNSEDPSDNYIVVSANGKLKEMRWPPRRIAESKKLKVHMKDGKEHLAQIKYDPPALRILLDNAEVLKSTVNLSAVTDEQGNAFVGFTAATGGGWQNHDLLAWNYQSTSAMLLVDSKIAFCMPDRTLCTPFEATVEQSSPGHYHVVLPANLEEGVLVPLRNATVANLAGRVCLEGATCRGPEQSALLQRVVEGGTLFLIADRPGEFGDNSGYYEFDVNPR